MTVWGAPVCTVTLIGLAPPTGLLTGPRRTAPATAGAPMAPTAHKAGGVRSSSGSSRGWEEWRRPGRGCPPGRQTRLPLVDLRHSDEIMTRALHSGATKGRVDR